MQNLILECAVRATFIAAATALVLGALRVKTPALRYAAWTGVVVAMLLLPLWTALGPKARLRVLPPLSSPSLSLATAPAAAPAETVALPESPGSPVPDPKWNWSKVSIGVYLVGLCVLLARLTIGTIRAHRMIRRAAMRDGRLTSPDCTAPITVGWIHPAVILPDGWRQWPPGQLSAVLAHEGEHVRRRDPLIQWLALLNRALFWFHPLSWWLERHLSGLAEESCDRAVLERGYSAQDYSEYLLDMARAVVQRGTRVNVWGMAMPGSGLPRRIRQILDVCPAPRISRARTACCAAACVGVTAVFAAGTIERGRSPILLAQVQTAVSPAFEVASVRPGLNLEAIRASRGRLKVAPRMVHGPGSITYTNVTLQDCIKAAYQVWDYQVSGPDWLDEERYTIVAKAGTASRAELMQMLQRLLAERFGLALHREKKELPAFALVARSGSKLRPAEAGAEGASSLLGNLKVGVADGMLRLGPQSMSVPTLAEFLSKEIRQRPVVDMTGMNGIFEITLSWVSDDPEVQRKVTAVAGEAATGPSIFTAIQEQLGLKLEPQKALVEVLVVDRAEKVPTGNE